MQTAHIDLFRAEPAPDGVSRMNVSDWLVGLLRGCSDCRFTGPDENGERWLTRGCSAADYWIAPGSRLSDAHFHCRWFRGLSL